MKIHFSSGVIMAKMLTNALLILSLIVSCSESSKDTRETTVLPKDLKSNHSDEFQELVRSHGQYVVVLAIINIAITQNKESELAQVVRDWSYMDYKELISKSIDSNEVFDKALRNQEVTLKNSGSLSSVVENWIEIYGLINHLRKLDFDVSFEEFLYSVSEMKPIMETFFHENNIQEWSSMSYSQYYQFDYYLCNYMSNASEYKRMSLVKAIIDASVRQMRTSSTHSQ